MNEILKKLIFLLIVLFFLATGVYYLIFQNRNQIIEQQDAQQERAMKENLINDLVNKYKAIDDWEDRDTYTIQLQDRLISNMPALFKGSITDIYLQDGKKYFKLESSLSSININYYLELECNKNDVINKIIGQEKTFLSKYDDYLVIASVSSIIKPIYGLKGSVSEDQVEINVEPSENFIIRGICLDVVKI